MGTPSEDIIQAANVTATLTDDRGRSITIRKLQPLDRMRFAEIIGAENVRNEIYLGYASLAYHVTAIDGETVPRPNSKLALEAIVQKLGDGGLAAVSKGIEAKFLDQPMSEDEAKGAIKN